ncbi:helix-turn-helix transcriptional regulator [Halogranum amylolyticum]|nr:helix-turn-helix transcriptional regulator [Halogranum amylolyticum]
MEQLTGFQRDILYVISGLEEPYGLAIKDELEKYYEHEVNHGRLYPNLDDLVENDFVQKSALDRRTNSYTLTESGYKALEVRREWEEQNLQTT